MILRFRIFATDANTGEEFECFTWTRDAEAGIARAYRDAADHGIAVRDVRAEAM